MAANEVHISSRTLATEGSKRNLSKKGKSKQELNSTLAPNGEAFAEYYSVSVAETVDSMHTDLFRGLSEETATQRLAVYGSNNLSSGHSRSKAQIILSNIFNMMNGILLAALVISIYDAYHDTNHDKFVASIPSLLIFIIIFLNSSLAIYQELKGEKKMEALKKLGSPIAKVIRETLKHVRSEDVVLGDVVVLDEGDQAPADIRLFEVINLKMNETLLTGESIQIQKKSDPCPCGAPLGDRENMVFKSTYVASGRGKGVVVGTGSLSEIGKIAVAVSGQTSSKTPLQKAMDKMMIFLFIFSIILGILVVLILKDFGITKALMYAIATSVAIIPEGLPLATIITMIGGVNLMTKAGAIVRKQTSLEALRQVTNVCSDKTGTLTEGKMSLTEAFVNEEQVKFTGSFGLEGSMESKLQKEDLHNFFLVSGLCNTCDVQVNHQEDIYNAIGDSTEIALAIVAHRNGYSKANLFKEFQFVSEFSFDSTIKRMSVVYRCKKTNDVIIVSKGAMEQMLKLCDDYFPEKRPCNHSLFAQANQRLTSQGLRVLALAMKRIKASQVTREMLEMFHDQEERQNVELNLTLVGLAGIRDPPRLETAMSIACCHEAGIVVHMITGDHRDTAMAIAREIGIFKTKSQEALTMTSMEFDALTEQELDNLEELPLVVARCSPATKVNMIKALHRRKKYVAMTGDGVNDAPAIHYADVGIAMGKSGSDVTKEASDITITDDKFSTIVTAISQGRRIFDNIQKFSLHFLSGNVSEVIVLIFGLHKHIFPKNKEKELEFPMSAIQILFLNFVTSAPLAILLGRERPSSKIMKQPPKNHGVFSWELILDTMFYGIIMGLLSLFGFELPLKSPKNYRQARALSYVTLSFLLLVHGFNCRSLRRSIFKSSFDENKPMLLMFFCGALLTIFTLFFQDIFNHELFELEWLYVLGSVVVFLISSELFKFCKRRFARKQKIQ